MINGVSGSVQVELVASLVLVVLLELVGLLAQVVGLEQSI